MGETNRSVVVVVVAAAAVVGPWLYVCLIPAVPGLTSRMINLCLIVLFHIATVQKVEGSFTFLSSVFFFGVFFLEEGVIFHCILWVERYSHPWFFAL